MPMLARIANNQRFLGKKPRGNGEAANRLVKLTGRRHPCWFVTIAHFVRCSNPDLIPVQSLDLFIMNSY
jgi:hypothetical protein